MVYLFLQCMNKQGLVIKIPFVLHTSIFVLEMCSSILQFCPREDLRWKELCLVASHFCKAYNLKKKKKKSPSTQTRDAFITCWQIHSCLCEILKTVQDVQGDANRDQASNDFFKSVADLMDGRLVHSVFSVVLQQRSKGVEGGL